MKLCIILTTRGNYAKFKRILELTALDDHFDIQTVVGGELLLHDRVISQLDVEATQRVYFNVAGDNSVAMGKSMGLAVSEFCTAFWNLKPDMVMLVGDRFETHGAAVAAYICGIPIAHLEGGEISGTLDNRLRYAISELSDYHFACTKNACMELMDRFYDGNDEVIHQVGSTVIDALVHTEMKTAADFMELQKTSGSGGIIDVNLPFLLVIQHPDTSNPDGILSEIRVLIGAIDQFKMPTIWINSNMDAGAGTIGHVIRQYRDNNDTSFIRLFKSLPIEYYGYLLKNTACIVGNSSSGIREASFFGTPNMSIGKRQEGREVGKNTRFVAVEKKDITAMMYGQINHGPYPKDHLYGDGTASEKILEVLRKI